MNMNTTYTICMCAITCAVNIHLHFMGMIIAHLGLVLAKRKLFNTENAWGKYMTCFHSRNNTHYVFTFDDNRNGNYKIIKRDSRMQQNITFCDNTIAIKPFHQWLY